MGRWEDGQMGEMGERERERGMDSVVFGLYCTVQYRCRYGYSTGIVP